MKKIHFSFDMLLPRYWPVWVGIGIWYLAVQTLPFKCQMWLGGKLGRLTGAVDKRRPIIARKNIDLCFPELSDVERSQLVKEVLESTGRGFFDTGIAWFWPYWRLKKVLDIRGLKQVLDAYDDGQGVILFTFHFTSLEIGIAGVSRNYPHINYGVYRPHKNKVFDYVMRKGRERHVSNFIAVPRRDVRAMAKALRQGKMLGYLPDQDYGKRYSTFVPFFGVDAATITAPTQLAKLGRAKVMSFCVFRKPDGSGYLIQVYPEFEQYGLDETADAKTLNHFVEQRIREYPDQYLWVHRRFKSQLDGNEDFYELQKLKSFQRRNKRRMKRK